MLDKAKGKYYLIDNFNIHLRNKDENICLEEYEIKNKNGGRLLEINAEYHLNIANTTCSIKKYKEDGRDQRSTANLIIARKSSKTRTWK